MTKHTPGPWSKFGPGSPQIFGGDPVRRIAVMDHMTGAPMDECYANARLIAAAPELLEALRDVLHHQVYGTSTSLPLAIERAQAAIVKAEGRP